MTEWLKDRSTIIVKRHKDFLLHCQQYLWILNLHSWMMYFSDLSACGDSIGKMPHVINCYLENSELSINISSVYNYYLDWDHLDMLAHSLWPRSKSLQINTSAAGDCLPCSISRLVAGTEFLARELRTCMTIEVISNHNWHLDHSNLILSCPPIGQLRFVTCKVCLSKSFQCE